MIKHQFVIGLDMAFFTASKQVAIEAAHNASQNDRQKKPASVCVQANIETQPIMAE
jgi:hypothetical protein